MRALALVSTVLCGLAAPTLTTPAAATPVSGAAAGRFSDFDAGGSTATATIINPASTGPATFAFGGTPASYITFDGTGGFAVDLADLTTPFAIGAISALKSPTTIYPNGTSVILTTTIAFTAPVLTTATLTFTLDIGIFPGLIDGTTDADIFGTGDILPATIDYAGNRYDLALVGFDADGVTPDLALTEGTIFSGQLFAQLTPDPTPVPEPASLLLLAIPVLAGLRRRTT